MRNGIGVLDSGVGGLTVAREIMRQLPQESIYYFGDTARCPYGPRPQEEIRAFTLQMIDYLSQLDIKALVIACNTATAVVLKEVEQTSKIPVIGVIDPGARTAIKETKTGKVGVIGTIGTIRSEAYEKALKRIDPTVDVYSMACPDFVPLVESGIHDHQRVLSTVEATLKPMLENPIDTLILGCTHYPLLSDYISQVMGPDVTLISSARETARELSTVLAYQGILQEGCTLERPRHQFFVSGKAAVMKEIAESWLSAPLEIYQVDLK
ncbi:MAG TPA: glutamate racemase [Bacillota bacterium]|nr:glutamate racemase [Bacillota bacterium]